MRDSDGTAFTRVLGTIGPEDHPHIAGVGAAWLDDNRDFTSDLAANPACTIAVKLAGLDPTLFGIAAPVGDAATLEQLAALYRDGGWPAEVAGDALTAPYSAPGAGPPPWHALRFRFDRVVGVATAEPHGAARWDFAS